jgi:hypothetical protein
MCDGGELPEMQIRRPRASGEASERDRYLSALNQAQAEYDVARSCFAEAVESEIIDEAIYLMEAARKKYSYFLRKVRGSYS